MSVEADARCGAGYGEVSPDRVSTRNGCRHRDFDTCAGTVGARPGAARACPLNDVDLGNRRLLIHGAVRTSTILRYWLEHRQPAPADQPTDPAGTGPVSNVRSRGRSAVTRLEPSGPPPCPARTGCCRC